MTNVDSKLRVVLLLAATFVAGAAAGVAADRFSLVPGSARAEVTTGVGERRGGGRGRGETTIERFADELELTAEQRQDIDGVLEHYRASMKQVWSDVRPRYRTLVDSARLEIEARLTPEQVEQYRALLHSRRTRDREHSEGETGEDR